MQKSKDIGAIRRQLQDVQRLHHSKTQAQTHQKAEANLAEKKADNREKKGLCSSKKWCPSIDFTGGKKICDTCTKLARALTKAKKEVQYSVPAYAANTTSALDFL